MQKRSPEPDDVSTTLASFLFSLDVFVLAGLMYAAVHESLTVPHTATSVVAIMLLFAAYKTCTSISNPHSTQIRLSGMSAAAADTGIPDPSSSTSATISCQT